MQLDLTAKVIDIGKVGEKGGYLVTVYQALTRTGANIYASSDPNLVIGEEYTFPVRVRPDRYQGVAYSLASANK